MSLDVEAVVMRSYGAPGVLALERVPEPMAVPGWIVVELRSAGLNWHDVLVRKGSYPGPLPLVIGSDGAGRRRDTGEEVVILPSLFWGDRDAAPDPGFEILGDLRAGTYAELVAVPQECLFPRPRGFSDQQAATLALSGVTVYRGLFSRGRLRAGESVLVLGAGGGVATTAVSLAVAAGARVAVTSSATGKIDAARGLGAIGGVDHTEENWVAHARSLTRGGRGFDLVLDPVGRWEESIACLRPGGRCVVLGASAHATATIGVRSYYFGQYELIGTTLGSPRDMAGLVGFFDRARPQPPVIDRVFGLVDAADAHARLESGEGFGKVALEIS